jgi:hypothetical protein
MIRKMLVIAAAVAMPVTAITAVTTSGVAGAVKPAPVAGSVALSGLVTFAAPGLSAGGAITNKTVESALSLITPAGGIAGTKSIKSKIPTATSPCWSTLPVYSKTAPTGGTLASGAPAATCDVGGGAASTDSPVVPADVKTAIKDQNYYDTSGSFASTGTASIVAALNAKPIKVSDNGNNSVVTVLDANNVAGGACGTTVGFQIDGTITLTGITHVSVLVCLTTDTGTNVTGDFTTDILGSSATIATGTVGGNSAITFSA